MATKSYGDKPKRPNKNNKSSNRKKPSLQDIAKKSGWSKNKPKTRGTGSKKRK